MKLAHLMLAIALAAGPVSVDLALAQDASGLSAEDIAARLKKQKTRGIQLMPRTDGQTTTGDTATPVTPVSADGYVQVDADIALVQPIQFDFDSAALRSDQKPTLDKFCEGIKAADVPLVKIFGHTDAAGSAEYNKKLSQLRAEEVKRYLVGCGIPAEHLEAVGVGEDHLLDPGDPRSDRNRRVEFQAVS